MYYIEQSEGLLYDASHALHTALRALDYETAESIYREHVGEPPAPADINDCWWLYNAANRVRRAYHVEVAYDHNGERYAHALARAATRKHGGTWVVHYEY